MLRHPARIVVVLMLAITVAVLATARGCGPGAGSDTGAVSLLLTRDFGTQTLQARTVAEVPSSDTVMRLLERTTKVDTRFGGGFVQCIDGLCGGEEGGRPVDWFYFVDGVEAPKGAAATRVRANDSIWWDRRDWSAGQRVPAVVGQFPEPFRHGPATERRLPTRVECEDLGGPACRAVQAELGRADVVGGGAPLRATAAEDSLRILVGTWAAVREEKALIRLEDGPGSSGVYARPTDAGRRLVLLDAAGRTRRTLGAGWGLVAATRAGEEPPVWVVTGADAAGVAAAAAAFRRDVLRGRYAVAVHAAERIPLPVEPAG